MEDIVKITSDDTKLIMQPFGNWEEFLVSAPVSIAILVELICISSKVDFSIGQNPPKDSFLYIKYPDSFCGSLMQVANSGSAAFNEAHKNMDQIRLNTDYMTAYIKTSMKLLLQENDELVQTLLPDHLEIIATISDECVELADQTERKFTLTIYLIEELLGAYLSTRKHILERDNECAQRKCEDKEQDKESRKKRAGDMAVENARFRIEQSRAQLAKSRVLQKQILENQEKNQKELTEILNTLRNYEVKEIDFETPIKMLIKGLDAMGRVKEQWDKMVRFFRVISNIVKTCLDRSLTDFVKQSQEASQKHLSYNTKKFMKDLIYQQAFYTSNVASLVNMISGTYVEISDKQLMDMVSSLGKLMALDPSKSYLESKCRELHDACENAQEAIRDLVKNNNKKFDQKAKERMEKIVKELQSMLPPVSEEKMKEIKETTESAFKEMSQEDEDQFA